MAFLTTTTFDYRRALMRRMMEANGLDALAFLTRDFFQWATNFHVDVQPWERPIVAVVPLNGEPFAIMNELSTNHLRGRIEHGTMWITDVTLIPNIRVSRRACRCGPSGPRLPPIFSRPEASRAAASALTGAEGRSLVFRPCCRT